MRTLFFTAIAIVLPGAAIAQPTLADACLRAAQIELRLPALEATAVQAFPHLDPPRVQMTVVGVGSAVDALIDQLDSGTVTQPTTTIRCAFDSDVPPFGLRTLTCGDLSCLVSTERLAELRDLLQREDY